MVIGPPPNPGVARLTQRTSLQLVLPVRVVALGRASAGAAPACSSSHRFAAAGPSRSILRRYSALFLEKAACRSACETCRDGVVRGGAFDLLSPGLSVTMSLWLRRSVSSPTDSSFVPRSTFLPTGPGVGNYA